MSNMRLIREGLEAADDLTVLFRSILGEEITANEKRIKKLEKIISEKRILIHIALAEAVAAEKLTTKNRTSL